MHLQVLTNNTEVSENLKEKFKDVYEYQENVEKI